MGVGIYIQEPLSKQTLHRSVMVVVNEMKEEKKSTTLDRRRVVTKPN